MTRTPTSTPWPSGADPRPDGTIDPAFEAAAEEFNTSPVVRLLGLRLVHLKPGRARLVLDVNGRHRNLRGVVHGGITATLLDAACGNALRAALGPGGSVTTVELKVNFLAPITEGRLVAEGQAVHVGSTLAVARGDLYYLPPGDPGDAPPEKPPAGAPAGPGRLVATALATFYVLDRG